MSTIGTALVTWEEFLKLPEPADTGLRYELHDGEVIYRVFPKPRHARIQILLIEWLNSVAEKRGVGVTEFSYRPSPDLQYWTADVAFVPREEIARMDTDNYLVYSPPLIVEVLSPSNVASKISRQRVVAFSAGTREFWVVDPLRQTIEVSLPNQSSRIYSIEEEVPVAVLPGVSLPVGILFKRQL